MCPGATERAPVTDTLGLQNSSPSSKRYSISPLEVKKRRCRYVIYKRIDTSSYYGYRNDEDGILEKVEWPTGGGDVRQSTEEVAEDRVHALNYERHKRVIASTKHNLHKTLIVEVCIRTLSIKLFLDAFYVTTTPVHFQSHLVHYKQYSTHVYCVFSNHVDVVVV
jgi:hypothetical protein